MAVGRWRVKIIGWMMVILVRFYVYCSNQVAVCFESGSEKTSFYEGLSKVTRTKPREKYEVRGSKCEMRDARFEVRGLRYGIRDS